MQTLNIFHRSDILHNDAGTFFRYYYDDAERIYSLFDSLCWANQLLYGEALDVAKLFFRNQIPAFHRDLFKPITVSEQEYRDGRKKTLVYGGTPTIRYGDDYYYGVPAALITGAVALPETDGKIVDIDICCDLPVDPTILLLKGEHFVIRNNNIVFLQDLFDLMPSEGEAPNRTLTLWLRSVYSDRNYLQDRLGVLTQTQGSSSPEYAAFANGVLDNIIRGTSYHTLTQLICCLFDVPCSEYSEVVEQTGTSPTGYWLATDRKVYRSPLSASFLYRQGDTVPPGTILTDAITPIYGRVFPDGEPLLLERRFLGQEYIAGLIFPNEELPLTFDRNRPVFKIIGRNEDIRLFWNTVYSRITDKMFLIKAAVGGRINPAKFIYENILYPRARFYRIYTDRLGVNRLPTVNTKILRDLLPPGILFDMLLLGVPVQSELSLPIRGRCTVPVPSPPKVSAVLPEFTFNTTVSYC
jgi:hypothetical protein